MLATSPFRWILTLLAMVMPVTAATCRASDTGETPTLQQDRDDHVVFRHYL